MRRVLLLTIALWVPALTGYADESIDIDGRTVDVHVPASYSPSNPAAVVVLLHGFGGNGRQMERYMRFERLADEEGFLYLHPNGSRRRGRRYWAATDACCNFRSGSVDDVEFLSALLDEVGRRFSVDSSRIYLVGHSNGGFMSYRMACEHADRFAAIVSLAGATWSDPRACRPSEALHTLQIHGTRDEIIRYRGGSLERGVRYPGAVTTTETWARYNGCSVSPDTSPPNRGGAIRGRLFGGRLCRAVDDRRRRAHPVTLEQLRPRGGRLPARPPEAGSGKRVADVGYSSASVGRIQP